MQSRWVAPTSMKYSESVCKMSEWKVLTCKNQTLNCKQSAQLRANSNCNETSINYLCLLAFHNLICEIAFAFFSCSASQARKPIILFIINIQGWICVWVEWARSKTSRWCVYRIIHQFYYLPAVCHPSHHLLFACLLVSCAPYQHMNTALRVQSRSHLKEKPACTRYRAAPCVWRSGIWGREGKKKASSHVKKRQGGMGGVGGQWSDKSTPE